jgi:hypothetical protein
MSVLLLMNTSHAYSAMLTVNTLLTLQRVATNVGDKGVGVRNTTANVGNDGMGIRDIVMNVRNDSVWICDIATNVCITACGRRKHAGRSWSTWGSQWRRIKCCTNRYSPSGSAFDSEGAGESSYRKAPR